MKMLKKIIAKEFVWFLAAFIFAFPLALIPLSLTEVLIADFTEFMIRIDHQVVLIYFIFVTTCFLGILLIRFVSSAIRILFEPKEN